MEKKTVVKKVLTKVRKKWVNSNKPTQDGITFDSDLELTMYRLLKEAEIPFEYLGGHKAKYTLIEEFKYSAGCYERAQKRSSEMKDTIKVSKITMTPDFIVGKGEAVIEVKGRKMPDFALRWKIFKAKMMESEKPPILFLPMTKDDCVQTLHLIKKLYYE